MIGSMWSRFIDNGGNSRMSRLLGPWHFRQMVRNNDKSTQNNKDMRFKRERKLKYNLSNASIFKRCQVLDDDEMEWNGGGGIWHVTVESSKDKGFYDIKGIYKFELYLEELLFLPKCYYSFNLCFWFRTEEGVSIFVKDISMGAIYFILKPRRLMTTLRILSLGMYMLKEGGLVSFMEVMNGYDEGCSL